MGDTHESVRNLDEMLRSLAENQMRRGQQEQEQDFRNRQLVQSGQEMDENRKARASQLAEMVNARRQQAFLPFQEKLLNEEQRMHPKWSLQQQVQDALGQMKPEYRNMSAFGYDKNFKQPGEAGAGGNNPLGVDQGGGIDILKALGLSPPPEFRFQVPGNDITEVNRFGGMTPEEKMMNQLTPYARGRALKMKLSPDQLASEDISSLDTQQGSGSNVGF